MLPNSMCTYCTGKMIASFPRTLSAEFVTNSPPVIIQGPQTAFVGIYGFVNLTCVASGSPQPTIQWYKDNALLQGEVFPSYVIQSVELNDRGVYHCEATNDLGTVRSQTAVVNILGIQQYVVELLIPLRGFGVSTFSDVVVDNARSLVNTVSKCSTIIILYCTK